MHNGIVKFFDTAKGAGVVAPVSGGGGDAFVHLSALQFSGLDAVYERDNFTYDLETGRDGRASAVTLQLA